MQDTNICNYEVVFHKNEHEYFSMSVKKIQYDNVAEKITSIPPAKFCEMANFGYLVPDFPRN